MEDAASEILKYAPFSTDKIFKDLKIKSSAFYIKLLKENRIPLVAVAILLWMIYRWYKDKNIKIVCKKTSRNSKILHSLK